MTIFSFWNNRKNIPAYLQLCVNTWRKFIPNHEIKILDVDEFLSCTGMKDSEIWKNLSSGKCKWSIVADFVRIELLRRYGGVWMDLDTIVTSPMFEKEILQKHVSGLNSIMGDNKGNVSNAFLISDRNSNFINTVHAEQVKKIQKISRINGKVGWDYICYSVIFPYFRSHQSEFNVLDLPSRWPERNIPGNGWARYNQFYFKEKHHLKDISGTPMIMLHNAWTPDEYRNANKKEVLSRNCTLSNVLRELNV